MLKLNHDPTGTINKRFGELKQSSITDFAKLAKCVADVHAQKKSLNTLGKYSVQWVMEQVENIEDAQQREDIMSAVQIMSNAENHAVSQNPTKGAESKFLMWDIASILNCANDAQFSDKFLKAYLKHGGMKPALVELYTNLYYVKVIEAIEAQDLESVMHTTRQIIEDTMFDTDIISYETLVELGINGY